MKPTLFKRAVSYAVAFTVAYTPILGSLSGTVARAQSAQPTTSYQYDLAGNLTAVNAPLGRVTNHTYDILDRVTKQESPLTNGARPTVQLAYDKLDQLSTVTDPRTLVTTYTVDGLGNGSGLSSPDTGASSRTFDAAGRVFTSTDARNKLTRYGYDATGRLAKITYATGSPTVFEYDGGTAGPVAHIGQLTKITDESGQTLFTYNGFGELTSAASTIGSRTYTTSYTFGTAGETVGKMTSMRYPSGSTLNYLYRATGELSRIVFNPGMADGSTSTAPATVILGEFTHGATGVVTGWTWGQGSAGAANVYSRTVDINGRITDYPLEPGANGLRRSIVYDDAGRIVGYTHTQNGVAKPSADQGFGYDPMDRLISWTSNATTQS